MLGLESLCAGSMLLLQHWMNPQQSPKSLGKAAWNELWIRWYVSSKGDLLSFPVVAHNREAIILSCLFSSHSAAVCHHEIIFRFCRPLFGNRFCRPLFGNTTATAKEYDVKMGVAQNKTANFELKIWPCLNWDFLEKDKDMAKIWPVNQYAKKGGADFAHERKKTFEPFNWKFDFFVDRHAERCQRFGQWIGMPWKMGGANFELKIWLFVTCAFPQKKDRERWQTFDQRISMIRRVGLTWRRKEKENIETLRWKFDFSSVATLLKRTNRDGKDLTSEPRCFPM